MKTKENKTILKKQLCNDLIENGKVNEGDIVKHSFTNQIMSGKKKSVEKSNEMIALTTRGDTIGVCVKVDRDERERERERSSSLRIRKLTGKECLRLMSFTDDDYEAMRNAGLSESMVYHCAGDSICVNVLINIFGTLMPITEDDRLNITNTYIESIKEK